MVYNCRHFFKNWKWRRNACIPSLNSDPCGSNLSSNTPKFLENSLFIFWEEQRLSTFSAPGLPILGAISNTDTESSRPLKILLLSIVSKCDSVRLYWSFLYQKLKLFKFYSTLVCLFLFLFSFIFSHSILIHLRLRSLLEELRLKIWAE